MPDDVEKIMGVIIDSIPGDASYVGNGQFTRTGGDLLQACHGCGNLIPCDDHALASFIQKYGCGNCIWKQSEILAKEISHGRGYDSREQGRGTAKAR